MDKDIKVFSTDEETLSRDIGYARLNTYKTMEIVNSALEELEELAKSSQNPRAYEVLATLARVAVDGNSSLINMQKTRKEIMGSDGPKTVTNNLVLTTEQLQKLLESKQSSSE